MRWRVRPPASRWQRWFAWHPVFAGDCWVWLEWVERTEHESWGDSWYEYLLIEEESNEA